MTGPICLFFRTSGKKKQWTINLKISSGLPFTSYKDIITQIGMPSTEIRLYSKLYCNYIKINKCISIQNIVKIYLVQLRARKQGISTQNNLFECIENIR